MPTGSIRKRTNKDGSSSYQITIEGERDNVSGKRERIYCTVKGSKKQAQVKMQEMLTKYNAPETMYHSSMQKLKAWLDEWTELYLCELSPTTKVGYKDKIRNNVVPYLGQIPISQIETNDVQKWLIALKEKGLASKTIRESYGCLKRALDIAVQQHKLRENPCTGAKLPKVSKAKMTYYSKEEIINALKCAEGTDMYLILLLATNAGLRRGELLALKWKNVDTENGIIHISENRVHGDKEVITKTPKSQSGVRDIPIGSHVLTILRKAKLEYQWKANRAGFKDDDYVIHKEDGTPYHPDSLTQKWERFIVAQGLRPVRFHDLRHSYATAMLEAGVDMKTLQSLMGHANYSITADIYSHVTEKMNVSAANKLDEALFSETA